MNKNLIVFIFSISFILNAATFPFDDMPDSPEKVKLSQIEMDLYNQIMVYRKSKGLKKIPISPSLQFVAQLHARDVAINKPQNGPGNLHSWSNKGPWSAVAYYGDHRNAKGMWVKPKELSSYNGYGFEIAAMHSSPGAERFLNLWKSSSGHNGVIVNLGIWRKYEWKAIGVGIYGSYAVVWFGMEEDNLKYKE